MGRAANSLFGFLDLVPEFIERGESRGAHVDSALRGKALYGFTALLKLGVGAIEREGGVHVALAAQVHHRKQHVAEFGFETFVPRIG